MESFSLPLLKGEKLIAANPIDVDNQEKRVKYHKANLLEARQTAAEFVIALAKNQYKLQDSYTRRSILTLINIILFNTDVFNSQFRHHTLTIVKKRCYSLFSKSQQSQIQTTDRIAQTRKIHSSIYLSDDSKLLPDLFQNTFSWKGAYVSIEDNQTDFTSEISNNMIPIITYQSDHARLFNVASSIEYHFSSMWDSLDEEDWNRYSNIFFDKECVLFDFHDDNEIWIDDPKRERKEDEARLARLGHFNTLSKKPKVDKFKHRCGPKAQKHR